MTSVLKDALKRPEPDAVHIWREGLCYGEFVGYETEPCAQVRLIPFFDAGNRHPFRYRDGIWPHWYDPARLVTYQV